MSGIPKQKIVRVLCYHAVSDLTGFPVIESYGIPPSQFRKQLEILERMGFNFIGINELISYIKGENNLPSKAVLVSFDDCYHDLLEIALPILKEKSVPIIAFAITQRLGMTNEWDISLGAHTLQLLNEKEIKELDRKGVTLGSHSQSHIKLSNISADQMVKEVSGSFEDLRRIGFSGPLFFSYPYGVYNNKVIEAVKMAGFSAAFTVKPGFIKSNQDLFQLPRIEIYRRDKGLYFLLKVILAGRHYSLKEKWQSLTKWLGRFF